MKDIELNNEDWIQFQERCGWHFVKDYNKEHICTRGKCLRLSCAEFYCPRIKKQNIEIKTETKIIL